KVWVRSGITTDRVRAVVDAMTDGMADLYCLAGAVAEVLARRLPQLDPYGLPEGIANLEVTLNRDAELLIKVQGNDFVNQKVSVVRDDHGGSRLTVKRDVQRREHIQRIGDDA